MSRTEDFLERARATAKRVECLDVDAFWQRHDDYLVQAERIAGNPFFYPVYRYQNLYSFSPLPLMIHKGSFRPNAAALKDLRTPNNDVSRPGLFIDQDITRLGQQPELGRRLRDRDSFVAHMASAMQQDVDLIEQKNPGKTNVLLCGGRDSLNLLLLNWKNPVIAYSAAPNTPLVAEFVRRNGLDIEVRELLPEENPDLLPREIAEAATMVELENWKWAPHLVRIANMLEKNVVFWKGQFADAFLTDYWRSYTQSRASIAKFGKKVYRRLARQVPAALTAPVDHFFMQDFARAIWQRGAVAQGAHMGALRSMTDCLWVSGYHGTNTADVWLAADLPYLTTEDLRPGIGANLLGREVVYPGENPNPPALLKRQGLRDVAHFEQALRGFGLEIDEG